MKGSSGLSTMLVVALILAIGWSPARAGGTDLLLSSKLHGALALTASGFLLKEAIDAKKDANSQYDQYKLATSTLLAGELYDESKRNDTRSLLLLSGGLGTFVQVKGVALDVKGDPIFGKLQVQLRKGF